MSGMTSPSAVGRANGSVFGQLVRFALVGGVGTALYVGLFWVFALWMSSQAANIVSWVIATVVGNLIHRRFTYGVSGAHLRGMDGVVTFVTALAELGASSLLLAVFEGASSVEQGGLVVLGTIVGGLLRFVLNYWWFSRTEPALASAT